MPYRYIPVVRTKAGEADALGNLSGAATGKTLPLIRLGAAVPQTFLPKMISEAAGIPFALDGLYNYQTTGSLAVYQSLFSGLGQAGFPLIPVLSYRAPHVYNNAAAQFIGNYAPGFVLHVPLADLHVIANWVAEAPHWNTNEIDILIDAGDVSANDPVQMGNSIAQTINASNFSAQQWRSVTLHSWSAPRDVGQLNLGRNLVPRRDWQVWQHCRLLVGFQLDYSDSGHVNPSLDEVPGYAMANATISVRYAIDDNWIVYKGVRINGPNGIPMPVQYAGHAQTLITEQAFGGVAGCWGDGRVQHYATSPNGSGGRPQWAALLLNRHISLIADRIP